jgi:hypothetical protein
VDKLTLQNIEGELSTRICNLAEREGISPDEMVLKLVRKGVGLPAESEGGGRIGKSLDHFVGSMSQEEFDELQAALQHFEVVDDEG